MDKTLVAIIAIMTVGSVLLGILVNTPNQAQNNLSNKEIAEIIIHWPDHIERETGQYLPCTAQMYKLAYKLDPELEVTHPHRDAEQN